MKKYIRIASLVLVAMLMMSMTVIPSGAVSEVKYTEDDLHELIGYNDAVSVGHIDRLDEYEDMNTLVFANGDDTKTMYYYGEDIKYTDDNGVVRDKTNKLEHCDNAYVNPDNDIRLSFPERISEGVTVSFNEYEIKMTPVLRLNEEVGDAGDTALAVMSAEPRGKADTVTYSSVYGGKTAVRYTPLYSGMKEDIILASYTGIHEFQFVLKTAGLVLVSDMTSSDGSGELAGDANMSDTISWYFVDPKEPEIEVARLSNIFVYDNDGKRTMGSMSCTESADGEYIVTVSVSEEFLTAESTAFPVTIDPTITIGGGNSSPKGIMDATLSEKFPTDRMGSSMFLNVSGELKGHVVMKFPSLQTNSIFKLISTNMIQSATLNMYCVSNAGAKKMQISQYVPKYDEGGGWSETSITYSGHGVGVGSTSVTTSEPVAGKYNAFNITSIVKGWVNDSTWNSLRRGLIINPMPATSTYGVEFYSTEKNTSGYCPYLTITYNDSNLPIDEGYYLIKNVGQSKYLKIDGKINGNGTNAVISSLSYSPVGSITGSGGQVYIIDYYWRIDNTSSSYFKLYPLLSGYGHGKSLSNSLSMADSGVSWELVKVAANSNYYYIKYGSNYLTASSSGVTLGSKSGSTNQQWRFEKQSTFSRTLSVKSNGSAISGAKISFASNNMPERTVQYYQTTNASGNVTIKLLSGYKYGFNVTAYDRVTAYDDYVTGAGTSSFDVPKLDVSLRDDFNIPFNISSPGVSSPFGWRCFWIKDDDSGIRYINFGSHRGVDYRGNGVGKDTKALFACSGSITEVGGSETGDKGYYVTVRYNKDITVTYMHLKKDGRPAQGGKAVIGEVCGLVGDSGSGVTGHHLHVTIMYKNNPVDPQWFFK